MIDAGKAYSAVLYALFSIAGAGVAYLYFHGSVALGLVSVVTAIAVGVVVGNVVAQRALPDHPVTAMVLLEFWVLAPGGFATLAAALVIVVSVSLNAPASASVQDSKMLAALAGGLTALITAIFLKVFEDADDDVVGSRVKGVFERHYKRYEEGVPQTPGVARFTAGTAGENFVYSAVQIPGWSFTQRYKRARGIASRLATTDRHD